MCYTSILQGEIMKQTPFTDMLFSTLKEQLKNNKTPKEYRAYQANIAILMQASTFDTRKLTIQLAKHLSKVTDKEWLPIKYVLQPATDTQPQVESYAIILGESFFTIPNLYDFCTILDKPNKHHKFLYTDYSGHTKVKYIDTKSIENIWCFSSHNFINIGTKPQYSALINNNTIKTKPYLHTCLSPKNEDIFYSLGLENTYTTYSSMAEEEHPRNICMEYVGEKIEKNLYTLTRQTNPKNIHSNLKQPKSPKPTCKQYNHSDTYKTKKKIQDNLTKKYNQLSTNKKDFDIEKRL